MVRRPNQCRKPFYRWSVRLLFLGLFWTGSAFFLPHLFKPPLPEPAWVPPPEELQIGENRFGSFSLTQYDPLRNYRPLRSFRFSRLESSCAAVGFFQTAAFRELTLADVEIGLFAYPGQEDEQGSANAGLPDLLSLRPLLENLAAMAYQAPGTEIPLPEYGRLVQLTVDGFKCDWFYGTEPDLSVESRKAVLSPEAAVLRLQGDVTIRSGDRTLKANHVLLDMQAMRFTVRGGCMIREQSRPAFYRDIQADRRLNIQTDPILSQPTGDIPCLAQK